MRTCVKNLLLTARVSFSFLFLLAAPAYGQLKPTPNAINFGNEAVGTRRAVPVTLGNSSSTTFRIVAISSSNQEFSLSHQSLPVTLVPRQTLTVTVTFAPTAASAYSGTLGFAIRHRSTVKVPLSGTGTQSSPSVRGTLSFNSSLNFGTVAMSSSSTQTLSLSNSGSASVSISNISLAGPTVTLTGLSSGMILAPGQSTTIQASFSPPSSGSSSGKISITSNASNSPAVISWTATTPTSPAPSHSVELSWNASSSGGIVGYHVYRGPVSSGPYVLLTANPVTATNFVDSPVSPAETLFYVVTSVATGGVESGYSNEVSAVVP